MRKPACHVHITLRLCCVSVSAFSCIDEHAAEHRRSVLRLNFSRGVGRMMRVKASSLQELAKLVAEKLKVELPDDGAADVSMLEPGRKVPSPALTPSVDPLAETELRFGGVLQEPTFVTSLDQVPAKAKVQLWSKGTAPSSDPPAAGSSYTLTVTKSEAVRPNNSI